MTLLAIGVALCAISTLGMFVMRGVYDRLHFVGVSALGGLCIAVSIVVDGSFSETGAKALFVAIFVAITSPVLAHATARAARIAEHGSWQPNDSDDIDVEDTA